MAIVELNNISLSIGSNTILKNISFTVTKGKTLSVIGSSGSGKTTLLKTINNLLEIDEGEIKVFGKSVQEYQPELLRRKIGFVLQAPALLPHLNAIQNIATVPRLLHWPAEKIAERGHELMTLMGLEYKALAKRYPHELSGGQQQRVAIARALAANPELVLFDEPFSALDPITRAGLQQLVIDLKATLNKTQIFVTHDVNEAFTIGDEVLVLNKGRIEQHGRPEDIKAAPATAYVEQFISGLNA